MPGSCGVKLATKRWPPSERTDEVTRPPLTNISKLPEPAFEPSISNSTGRPMAPFGISCTRIARAPVALFSMGRNRDREL